MATTTVWPNGSGSAAWHGVPAALPSATRVLTAEAAITGADLAEISDDDGNSISYGSAGAYTGLHAQFDISGISGTITRFDAYADGYGHYFEIDPPLNAYGRKLYIWNYNTSAYELLATDASGSSLNVITGAITANLANYSSGGKVDVACQCEENYAGGGTNTIYTDYMKLLVTYTPPEPPAGGRAPQVIWT